MRPRHERVASRRGRRGWRSSLAALASPAPAQAAIASPALPGSGSRTRSTSGCPSPTDLIGKVFEFFFKTFFGIEARVTRRVVEWLLATPVYTDARAYAELNQLRAYIDGRGVGAVHAGVHGLGGPLLRLRLHLGRVV